MPRKQTTAPRRSGPPHYQSLTITLSRTTLDEWIAQRKDSYLTTGTHRRHPCPWQDSNPQTQQASGRRLTPSTAQRLGLSFCNYTLTNYSSLCVNMVVFKLEVTLEFFLEHCVFYQYTGWLLFLVLCSFKKWCRTSHPFSFHWWHLLHHQNAR